MWAEAVMLPHGTKALWVGSLDGRVILKRVACKTLRCGAFT